MKNMKGFTLVELLAAIIIISVLTLLASTSITSVVKNSKQDLYNNQLVLIKSAAEQWGSENIDLIPKTSSSFNSISRYVLLSDLQKSGLIDKNINNPKTGEIFTDDDVLIKINCNYNETYKKNKISYEVVTENIEEEKNNLNHVTHKNNYFKIGNPVYFDVEKGTECYIEEYEASYNETDKDYMNSYSNYNGLQETRTNNELQNSCLKFYVIDYFVYEGIVLELRVLLDHNTTSTITWTNDTTNENGPDVVLSELSNDTKNWHNNFMGPICGECTEIDYSEYDASLITAEEVANFVKNDDFSSWDSSPDDWFYFDFNFDYENYVGDYQTQVLLSSGISKYAWLYDRTSSTCKDYGCLNNSKGAESSGYWTSTLTAEDTTKAWGIDNTGSLKAFTVNDGTNIGVRPIVDLAIHLNN